MYVREGKTRKIRWNERNGGTTNCTEKLTNLAKERTPGRRMPRHLKFLLNEKALALPITGGFSSSSLLPGSPPLQQATSEQYREKEE